jgi:hypothetical protein
MDAVFVVCLGFGILWMRLFLNPNKPDWNKISAMRCKWFSIATAVIVISANIFPVCALWIPESLQELGTTIPWMVIPATGWTLIVTGFLYWAVLYWVIPLFHSVGKILSLREILLFS